MHVVMYVLVCLYGCIHTSYTCMYVQQDKSARCGRKASCWRCNENVTTCRPSSQAMPVSAHNAHTKHTRTYTYTYTYLAYWYTQRVCTHHETPVWCAPRTVAHSAEATVIRCVVKESENAGFGGGVRQAQRTREGTKTEGRLIPKQVSSCPRASS